MTFDKNNFFDYKEISNGLLSPVWGTIKDSSNIPLDWSLTAKSKEHLDAFSLLKQSDTFLDKGYIAYNNSYQNIYHLLREWIAALAIFRHFDLDKLGFKVVLPSNFGKLYYSDNEIIKHALDFFDLNKAVFFVDTSKLAISIGKIIYPRVLSGCFSSTPLVYFGEILVQFGRHILGKQNGYNNFANNKIAYISRADSSKRILVNEPDLSWLLHRNFGADILSLSDKPIHEIILMLNKYRTVISPHGAGLSNLSFILPNNEGKKFSMIEIMPRDYDNYLFSSIAQEREFYYSKYYSETITPNEPLVHNRRYFLNLNNLEASLKIDLTDK